MADPGSLGKYPDIDTCILFAVRDLLLQELQTNVDEDDPLRLKYICIGQLQEDYTRRKFSNAIALDFPNENNLPGKSWMKIEDPLLSQRSPVLVEMGGGGQQWMVRIYLRSEVYLKKEADEEGAFSKVTLERAAELRSSWFSRLRDALWGDAFLSGLHNSTGTESMTGGNWAVIEQYRMSEQGEKGNVILGVDMVLAYPVSKRQQ